MSGEAQKKNKIMANGNGVYIIYIYIWWWWWWRAEEEENYDNNGDDKNGSYDEEDSEAGKEGQRDKDEHDVYLYDKQWG